MTLYIGEKLRDDHVRCMKIDGVTHYPNYGHTITWEYIHKGRYVKITSSESDKEVIVPRNKTQYSGYKYWGVDMDPSHVYHDTDDDFLWHVELNMTYISLSQEVTGSEIGSIEEVFIVALAACTTFLLILTSFEPV